MFECLVSSGDGDYSDTSSNQEDSCSSSSSSPRDSSRHCDCCYCEVFGHGVVSKNKIAKIIHKQTNIFDK